MNNEFIKAVEENKVKTVRMMLSNELLMDPRGKTFSEMLEYAKDRMADLFEPNEPARFDIPADKEEWTADVVSKMKRDLNMNFSVEKLKLFEEMAKWNGRDKAEKLDNNDNINNGNNQRHESTKAQGHNNKPASTAARRRRTPRHTASFAIAGGAILTIAGICAGKTLITIIGGGIVVIGGVALMACRGEKK